MTLPCKLSLFDSAENENLWSSFEMNTLTHGHKILSLKTSVLGAAYSEDSWSSFAPFWYRSRVWQTDRRTDVVVVVVVAHIRTSRPWLNARSILLSRVKMKITVI